MSGLHFCMFTTFYPPHSFGGDAIGMQRFARALVKRGHAVTVILDVDAYNVLSPGPEPDVIDEKYLRRFSGTGQHRNYFQ